jgi:hypothetical protein
MECSEQAIGRKIDRPRVPWAPVSDPLPIRGTEGVGKSVTGASSLSAFSGCGDRQLAVSGSQAIVEPTGSATPRVVNGRPKRWPESPRKTAVRFPKSAGADPGVPGLRSAIERRG